MARTKGAISKPKPPKVYSYSAEQRLELIASLVLSIVMEEQGYVSN
jgi:hypothetical protein